MAPQHQYSLTLIHRRMNDSVIEQRSNDGYINATALCTAAGKPWYKYVSQETSGKFLRALSKKTGVSDVQLIQEVRAGGTSSVWVHPKVAIHLAQWLSEDFAVQVSEWVYDWMTGAAAQKSPATLPPHLNRYLKNDSKVPQGHFSILQETALSLFGPLHNLGFEIPQGWVPDISVGRIYCSWLRDKHGIDTDALPEYSHDYLDGRPLVQAKVYPESLLPDFRNWFRSVWLPAHGVKYFKKKDPSSLAFLDQLPALAVRKPPPSLNR